MKNNFFLTAVFTVSTLAIVGNARAALVLDVEMTDNGGLTTYILNFASDAGNVAGFQGLFSGDNGFEGNLVQELAGGALPTPTNDFNALIDQTKDSQFLLGNADILAAVAPGESSSSLSGAFTLQNAFRGPSLDLIQIVGVTGEPINYNFQVSEAIGSQSSSTVFQGVLNIPEPASILMASMGLIGLASLRRRRNA